MERMKRLFEVHHVEVPNGKRNWCIVGRPHGTRIRAWFGTREDAKKEAEKRNQELVDFGSKGLALSASQRQDAEGALQILAPYNLTLCDAAGAVVSRLKSALKTGSVKDAVEKSVAAYRAQHQRDNISERHLKTFVMIANRISKEFGTLPISELTPPKIENWLHGLKTRKGLPLQVSSRNSMRRYIGLILPTIKLGKERSRKMKAVHIVTSEQASLLVAHAPREVVPFFALGLWAGLRVSEIERLDWKHIKLAERSIDLSWFPTKTLQPRFVPICEKLASILQPFVRAEGRVCPPNLRRLREAAVKAVGFPWKQNTCRASFISYRLALIQDVGKVALEAGHDPGTLAAWYRRPMLKGEAEKYFS
jgi:integrase